MYRMYYDQTHLLYKPESLRKSHALLNPVLLQQLNRAATLTFTLPTVNEAYGNIGLLKTTIDLYDGEDLIFRGRPVEVKRTWLNDKEYYCEDGYAWLGDAVTRPYDFEAGDYDGTAEGFFGWLLGVYNDQADADGDYPLRHIYPGTVQLSGTYEDKDEGYGTVLEKLEALRKEIGGDMLIRYAQSGGGGWRVYLDWLTKDETNRTGQTIRFGKNLLDLDEQITAADIYTALLPVGKDGLTIESVNGGVDYIEDGAAVGLYGRIKRAETYSDIEDPSELMQAAQDDLAAALEAALTLDLEAVDLKTAGHNVAGFRLGWYNRAVSPPHGLDILVQCTRIQLRLQSLDKSQYRFGVERRLASSGQSALAAGMTQSATGTARQLKDLSDRIDTRGLPAVTASDNGKTLKVVDGEWKAVAENS